MQKLILKIVFILLLIIYSNGIVKLYLSTRYYNLVDLSTDTKSRPTDAGGYTGGRESLPGGVEPPLRPPYDHMAPTGGDKRTYFLLPFAASQFLRPGIASTNARNEISDAATMESRNGRLHSHFQSLPVSAMVTVPITSDRPAAMPNLAQVDQLAREMYPVTNGTARVTM